MFVLNGCLFIHIPKTGGTSIRQVMMDHGAWYLAQIRDPNAHVRKEPNLCDPHVPLRDAPAFIREHLLSFAVVRNPWDRFVSWWSFLRQKDPLDVWLDHVLFGDKRRKDLGRMMIATQSEYLEDNIDYVVRLEDMADEWPCIRLHLGIDVPLPHLNASKHEEFSKYYTDETIQMVAEVEAPLIEEFGYEVPVPGK